VLSVALRAGKYAADERGIIASVANRLIFNEFKPERASEVWPSVSFHI
jgi:hypothetical protein